MKQNVYAVYDRVDLRIYQFAALETTLAKDAVMAFVQENASALFGSGYDSDEQFKDFITALSQSSSIEEVVSVLEAHDLDFNMIQIN